MNISKPLTYKRYDSEICFLYLINLVYRYKEASVILHKILSKKYPLIFTYPHTGPSTDYYTEVCRLHWNKKKSYWALFLYSISAELWARGSDQYNSYRDFIFNISPPPIARSKYIWLYLLNRYSSVSREDLELLIMCVWFAPEFSLSVARYSVLMHLYSPTLYKYTLYFTLYF